LGRRNVNRLHTAQNPWGGDKDEWKTKEEASPKEEERRKA